MMHCKTREKYADGFVRPPSSNPINALATDDWFGTRSICIQCPSTRIWFTVLNDCDRR